MDVGRRAFLGSLAAVGGFAATRALGARGLFGGNPGDGSAMPQAEVIRALGASLTAKQRELVVLPFDHPSRQMTYSASVLELPHVGTLFSPEQQVLVDRLYATMLSDRGRRDLAGTIAVEGRLEGGMLALYGDPDSGRAQAVLTAGHLMLRSQDFAESGAAGGGLAYGHQTGNGRFRVDGNSFAYHGDAANRLYAALDASQRTRAVLSEAPHELLLQPQAAGASFPGLRVQSLEGPEREAFVDLLSTVLGGFSEDESDRARRSIEANGGIEALHVAYYASHGFYADGATWGSLDRAERARRGDPYWQVWRIEGPGTVVHFKGHPHVHAYVRVVPDPGRANVGEVLGQTDRLVDGDELRAVYEAALLRASGEECAYSQEQLPGRFCPGEITTGLAWSLDPYRNRIVVASIDGRAMAAPLRARLESGGALVDPAARYRVATTDYLAGQPEWFGVPEEVEPLGVRVRDALVDHLRAGALA